MPGIEVAGEVRERMATARERDSVVLAEVDGGARQARALGGVLRDVGGSSR